MSNKSMKVIAKFNALHLASMQLELQCSPSDTLGDIDGVSSEIIDLIECELNIIIKSLKERAEKIESKYEVTIPNLVDVSQFGTL